MNPTDQFRSLLSEWRSREEALGELRRTGASPIQCIMAIHEVEGASLVTAKRLLCESPAWSDVVENTMTDFVNELERHDEDLSRFCESGTTHPSAGQGCRSGTRSPEPAIVNSARCSASRTCYHISEITQRSSRNGSSILMTSAQRAAGISPKTARSARCVGPERKFGFHHWSKLLLPMFCGSSTSGRTSRPASKSREANKFHVQGGTLFVITPYRYQKLKPSQLLATTYSRYRIPHICQRERS